MNYIVKEDGVYKADEESFWKSNQGIAVIKASKWDEDKSLRERFGIWHLSGKIHFCKAESYSDFIYVTFRVPPKESGRREIFFSMYITDKYVIILDNDNEIDNIVAHITDKSIHKDYTISRFLYDFLASFIDNDLIFLEHVEHEIADIEEDVLEGRTEKVSYRVLRIKKIIARFYHYYSQLMDIGDELAVNEEDFFNEDDLRMFRMYTDRVARLSEETQQLREYAMQVQDVYQSEIGIRQNDVMKMLTIVTTIFLPLTLIAGWYGMNFYYMPELHFKYAYPVVVIISILIVIISLIIFKKKKYW